MRAPDEKNKWIVDEKAAEVVKRIFDLCLQGVGIGKIASTLEKENVLNPTAHFIEQGDEVILTYNKEFWQEYAVKDLCLWAAGYF